MNDRKLTTAFYRPTESYKSIQEHIAVCFEDDLTLVAVVGASDNDPDHMTESNEYAALFAAAPETLKKLSHALARIAELNNELEKVSHGAVALAAEVARLTAGSEAMQEDARNNTATINKLKDALTRISHTSVTLGNSQSTWEAWRLCATIANEALK